MPPPFYRKPGLCVFVSPTRVISVTLIGCNLFDPPPSSLVDLVQEERARFDARAPVGFVKFALLAACSALFGGGEWVRFIHR